MSSEFARALMLLHRKRVSGPWFDMGGHRRAWNEAKLAELNRTARLKSTPPPFVMPPPSFRGKES
jgi:hypothetical protein